ncbi:MAG: hypothetical protein R2715_03450 [Ilumatobacteraceae bacterium]
MNDDTNPDMNDVNDVNDVNDMNERIARLAARRAAAMPTATAPAAATPTRPRKHHAARGSRNAALALSAISTLGLAGWFADTSSSGTVSGNAVPDNTVSDNTVPDNTVTGEQVANDPASDAQASAAVVPAAATTSELADGTYTGDSSSNRWGTVQVEIAVSGGEIAEVTILQYPDQDHKSVQINQRALPTDLRDVVGAEHRGRRISEPPTPATAGQSLQGGHRPAPAPPWRVMDRTLRVGSPPRTTHVEHVMGMAISIDVRDDLLAIAIDGVVAWLHHVDDTFSTHPARHADQPTGPRPRRWPT